MFIYIFLSHKCEHQSFSRWVTKEIPNFSCCGIRFPSPCGDDRQKWSLKCLCTGIEALKAHTVCRGYDKFCANIVIWQINLCVSVHILEYTTHSLCTKHYTFCGYSFYDVRYLKQYDSWRSQIKRSLIYHVSKQKSFVTMKYY